MKIAGKNVLVTGANRGIGRALVDELVQRGAGQVFAGARSAEALEALGEVDGRVKPLRLDVTKAADIEAAARAVGQLDLLINNAGSLVSFALFDTCVDLVDYRA